MIIMAGALSYIKGLLVQKLAERSEGDIALNTYTRSSVVVVVIVVVVVVVVGSTLFYYNDT